MLSQLDRQFVQMIRSARNIRITINIGDPDELQLVFNDRGQDIHKLTHDIALAVQEQLNKGQK